MPGGQEGEQVVNELLVGHGRAGVRIAHAHQPPKEIVAVPAGRAAVLQHGFDPCAQLSRRPSHGRFARVPDPAGQSQQASGELPGDLLEKLSACPLDSRAVGQRIA